MKLAADLHTHTIASGHAYSTVDEMAQGAAEAGLEILAITDHGPALPGGPHIYHFTNLRVLPERICGVRILKGVEANICTPEGGLDLEERVLKNLDIVLAGFHVKSGYDPGTVEENTRAMIGAIRNPYVDVIVHPGNPIYKVDIEAVVAAAAEAGKALEINNASLCGIRPGSETNCAAFAKMAAEMGAIVALGSDAHYHADVGKLGAALALALEAGVPPENILNVSADRVLKFLRDRGKLKDER